VFENRVLRRIFVPIRERVVGVWRGQHNKELYDIYGSKNTVRVMKSWKMRWSRHVACKEGLRNAYISVGKPENKGPLGRLKTHVGR
jgi:hypothetical protein